MWASPKTNAGIDIELDITGSSTGVPASALRLNRMEIVFNNSTSHISVDKNQTLTAQVKIRYEGNGILRGTWKVDGFPYYSEQKVLSFGNNIQLTSENRFILPTFMLGRHRVEFEAFALAPNGRVVQTVTVSGDYLVRNKVADIADSFKLKTPFNRAAVDLNKELFTWTTFAGASAYKMHIREKDYSQKSNDSRPVALTRKNSFEFSLSQSARFKYRQEYEWMVEAFDDRGRSLGFTSAYDFLNLTPVKGVEVDTIQLRSNQQASSVENPRVNNQIRLSADIENIGSNLSDIIVTTRINGELYDQRRVDNLPEANAVDHNLDWIPSRTGVNEIEIQVTSGGKVIGTSRRQVSVLDVGNDFLATNVSGGATGNDFVATRKDGAVRGNDFRATRKDGSSLGNNFIATVKPDRYLSEDYLAIPLPGVVGRGGTVDLDFRGKIKSSPLEEIIDFVERATDLELPDANEIDFTFPVSNFADAGEINFTIPNPGNNDISGVDFIAAQQGRNDISGVDFAASEQGKNDVSGVDFVADEQGKNDVSGVDFVAAEQGKNDVFGVDFVAAEQGKNDVSGVDFVAAEQGKNDVSGVDFVASEQGKNDVFGVDFVAAEQGKNDVSGVDFVATEQGQNDVSGVDFTATEQGKNDVSGVDFIATEQGNNDVSGVDFIADEQGKNDVSGVDFVAFKSIVVNVPELKSEGPGFKPMVIEVKELKSEGANQQETQ